MRKSEEIRIKTPAQLAGCRAAGEKAAEVLRLMCDAVKPGISTRQLDDFALEAMRALGCSSADYGYYDYPAQTCISVNSAVIHGVPRDDVVVKDGDLVSIDITVAYEGFVGDNARTVVVGGGTPETRAFVERTEEALLAGIGAARAGNRVGDISHAVERVANKYRYGIVREYVGHGCGVDMHEAPEIPNYGPSGRGPLLRPGMVLCIEPMFTLGGRKIRVSKEDGWTVYTADGSLACHSEQMIAITPSGPAEILTPR
ncbi:MAG: type I methionyl aminopeptidase [Kiritimatiellae bacterium]|nr:type I methionyl aminopeptidase [Kiritimatiellia bacterium]